MNIRCFAHLQIIVLCALRIIFFSIDPYGLYNIFGPSMSMILLDLSLPALTSAYALTAFLWWEMYIRIDSIQMTKAGDMPKTKRTFFTVLTCHWLATAILDGLAGRGIAFVPLMKACWLFFVVWGWLCCFVFIFVWVKVLSHPQLMNDTKLKLLYPLRHSAIRAIILNLVFGVLILYILFGIENTVLSSKTWLLVQFIQRCVELSYAVFTLRILPKSVEKTTVKYDDSQTCPEVPSTLSNRNLRMSIKVGKMEKKGSKILPVTKADAIDVNGTSDNETSKGSNDSNGNGKNGQKEPSTSIVVMF